MDKLSAVGLVKRREDTVQSTLAAFVDAYIAKRTDVKSSTAIVLRHTRRCLVGFFGANKRLREITLGEADDWRLFLLTDQSWLKTPSAGGAASQSSSFELLSGVG